MRNVDGRLRVNRAHCRQDSRSERDEGGSGLVWAEKHDGSASSVNSRSMDSLRRGAGGRYEVYGWVSASCLVVGVMGYVGIWAENLRGISRDM